MTVLALFLLFVVGGRASRRIPLLHLLELGYVMVDLLYVDLPGVIFVKHLEDGLVLLLVNCEVIGCHCSSKTITFFIFIYSKYCYNPT